MAAKTILITGITRGLGRALADYYIAAGHTVIGCGRSAEAVLDLRFTYNEPHSFEMLDVSQPHKVQIWAEKISGSHGAPDILINNAALMNKPAPLWKVPPEEFARLTAVNINGVANMISAFVPFMLEAGQGIIVNLSSGWGRSVSSEVAPYCATKFAIEGLTKALAEELPAPLAAIPLSPGVIDTEMLRLCWAEGAADHIKPAAWAKVAGPYILQLSRKDNGQSLRVET